MKFDTVSFSGPALRMMRDYPHMLGSIDRAVTSIDGLDIPAHEKQAIFSGTALRILNNV
jgi:hypothetical protein